MDQVTRLAFKMKLHKLKIPVVYQCALLIGVLKRSRRESELVSGFILYGDVACKHYWVVSQGENLDIATKLGTLYSPELASMPVQLVYELPDGTKRVDLEDDNNKIVIESDSHFELYKTDPKEFWNQKPNSLRNFKF